MLIGNKIDLTEQRKVTKQEAQNLADDHDIPYFETSAKLDQNVSEVMQFMMSQVYETSQKVSAKREEEVVRGSKLIPNAPPVDEHKDD